MLLLLPTSLVKSRDLGRGTELQKADATRSQVLGTKGCVPHEARDGVQ